MTDATQGGQPTEEEIRAYLGQIREADPAAIVVQAYQMLGEGAQIKLGRSDARVLIDAMAGIAEAVGDRLPAELVGQMKDGVGQLQVAQVQAEKESAAGAPSQAAQGAQRAPGAPGSAAAAAGQPAGGEGAQPSGQGQQEKLTDRLWVPGKGPKPGL